MSRFARSIPPAYFDDRYAADPDPWRFETSDYEREKYDATLAALPGSRYASVLEVGCSIGVLTARLAGRCDDLLGTDVAEGALDRARARCRGLGGVRFERGQAPGEWPGGSFELILLSEVVYYLDADDVDRLAKRVEGSLLPGGVVLLVHWTGETHYPLTGDRAAELFIASSRSFLRIAHQDRTDRYRLDLLSRP